MPYGVIGRAGFVSAFNFCIKVPFVTLERRLDERPLWQRIVLSLLPYRSRAYEYNEPL